jgi:predicted phosphodiesterase
MRALVISDIHGYIDALRAIELQWDGGLHQFDRIVCLGDLVDYGPDATEVIDWARSHATDVIRGNHDQPWPWVNPVKARPPIWRHRSPRGNVFARR